MSRPVLPSDWAIYKDGPRKPFSALGRKSVDVVTESLDMLTNIDCTFHGGVGCESCRLLLSHIHYASVDVEISVGVMPQPDGGESLT